MKRRDVAVAVLLTLGCALGLTPATAEEEYGGWVHCVDRHTTPAWLVVTCPVFDVEKATVQVVVDVATGVSREVLVPGYRTLYIWPVDALGYDKFTGKPIWPVGAIRGIPHVNIVRLKVGHDEEMVGVTAALRLDVEGSRSHYQRVDVANYTLTDADVVVTVVYPRGSILPLGR